MTIVDRLARRYGGDCRLVNADGGGLAVTVRLHDTVTPATSRSVEPS